MRKNTSGFTMIELLVVIAVIGILTTISIISFTRYQADSRDTQRSSRVTIIAEALEKYYDANGEYPSCNAMTAAASTVTTATLVGVDATVFRTPQADVVQTNSIDFCTDLSPSAASDSFAYVGDGTSACTTTSCLAYTLQYKEESTGQIISLSSRRTTDIITSGAIADLVAAAPNFVQINLTWTAVPNATGYAIEQSTDAGFASPVPLTNPTTNSATASNLTPGTQYWYRVAPLGVGDQGNWSNTATATTPELGTIACTATPSGIDQIIVTWTNVSLATSYTLQYANNSGFTSATVVTDLPTSPRSYTITGLTAGSTRYVQVRAMASGDTGDYCPYVSATTTVPAPTCLTATTNSTTQQTASWASCPVAVADTYTLQRATNSAFTTGLTTTTGLTGTSSVATGLTQGAQYWYRLYALVGATSSTASPTATAVTTISAPSSVSINSVVPGAVRRYDAGDWIDSPGPTNWYYAYGTAGGSCASGTTRQFRMGANYNSPTTFIGWTGWGTAATKYLVQPTGGYAVRFHVEARCVGSSATSGTTSYSSGYTYN